MRGAAIAMLAAFIAAPAVGQDGESGFERPYWLDRSVIEALGRAEVEAMPDEAAFSVTFLEVARSADDASAEAADRARLASEAMRRRGGDHVRISTEIEVTPLYAQYRDREGEMIDNERADRVENYAAEVTLNVEVRDIARAGDVRAAALAVGPEGAEDIAYSLQMTSEIQQRAYAAAVADAAARARIAAEGSGVRLGPLLALQEGRGPCLGSWYGPRPGTVGRAASGQAYAPAEADNERIVVTASRRREMTLTAEQIQRLQLPADPEPIRIEARVCAVYAAGAAQ